MVSRLGLRSDVTGLYSQVTAVLQSGWLHVLPVEGRAAPVLRSTLSLRDATLSTPPRPAGRLHVRVAAGASGGERTHEFSAPGDEAAVGWMLALTAAQEAAQEPSLQEADGGGGGGGGGGDDDGGGGGGDDEARQGGEAGGEAAQEAVDELDEGGEAGGSTLQPEELGGREDWGFFGCAHHGALQQRGAGYTGSWRPRWCAVLGTGELRVYEKPPELGAARLAVRVASARCTLRVHEASLLLSWAMGDGRVVSLRAGSTATLRAWAEAATHLGIALDATYQPPARRVPPLVRQVSTGRNVDGRPRWAVTVPSNEVLLDGAGRQAAWFSVHATRAGERFVTPRSLADVQQLHRRLVRLLPDAGGALPSPPESGGFFTRQLDAPSLLAKQRKLEEYLLELARLAAAPPVTPVLTDEQAAASQAWSPTAAQAEELDALLAGFLAPSLL